jgi:hypothetical protein
MIRRLVFFTFAAGLIHAPAALAATCDSLGVVLLQNARVTSAQMVAAGAFTPPAPPAVPGRDGGAGRGGARGGARGGGRGGNQPNPYAMLPAFCRVQATLTPSSDSDIKIEVWLPDGAAWNGKFQAVGNGGWAGTIGYPAMATALAAGYATTSTDTGHAGNTAAFALGHPEKVVDIAYRAVHEMTVQAKSIVNGRRGQRLVPHRAAGADRQHDLRRREGSEDRQSAHGWIAARHGAAVGNALQPRQLRQRDRSHEVHRDEGSGLGSGGVQPCD